jgi:hypothetical protein
MKKIGHGAETLIYCCWILFVILIFKIVSDKSMAGTITGSGFVIVPTFFLYNELKRTKTNYIHLTIIILFLVISALPIILLRVLNPGIPFDSIFLNGVSGKQLHQISNYTYLLMLISSLSRYIIEKRQTEDKIK